ncbi:MAG: 2-C-methyl-D-erythritol 2,4-cyclodiphosphate synthase [bacterium]
MARHETFRIGNGYDVHALVPGRDLVLGGVKIPYELGLKGHSDADVLIHAVCDALLGAAGLRDIGYHFPDTDTEYQGISSLIILKRVGELCCNTNYCIINIDATIIAEKPRLAPFVEQMENALSSTLQIDLSAVNIKATTNERIGFLGRGEGIAALAVALLEKRYKF